MAAVLVVLLFGVSIVITPTLGQFAPAEAAEAAPMPPLDGSRAGIQTSPTGAAPTREDEAAYRAANPTIPELPTPKPRKKANKIGKSPTKKPLKKAKH